MGAETASPYQGEIEDFFIKIRKLGYNEGDFTVRCLQWPMTAKRVSAGSDLIIVKRTSNEIAIAYAADAGTKWLLSFLEDLNNGVFDTGERPIHQPSVVKLERESEPQT